MFLLQSGLLQFSMGWDDTSVLPFGKECQQAEKGITAVLVGN